MDKSWIDEKDEFNSVYITGVESFLKFSRENALCFDGKILCPCNDCHNTKRKNLLEVKRDLHLKGFYVYYKEWTHHGESTVPRSFSSRPSNHNNDHAQNENSGDLDDNDTEIMDELLEMIGEMRDADLPEQSSKSNIENFERLLSDVRRELYPGRKKYSLLSFIVKLLQIKVVNKMTDKTMNMILELIKDILPVGETVPPSLYWDRKLLSKIGLGYKKIEVCRYDCALFWKENEKEELCPICKEPRWKYNDGKGKRTPYKVLWYFPLKPRCVKDGKISGLKTHDCHVLLQRLIPAGIRGYLRKDVTEALFELGEFFRTLCSKTLKEIRSSRVGRNYDGVEDLQEVELSVFALKVRPFGPLKNSPELSQKDLDTDRDDRRTTQNSGIFVEGEHNGNKMEFYGILTRVVELAFLQGHKVVLFQCEWFNTSNKKTMQMDKNFLSVDVRYHWYKDDPFVLPNQVQQVFYLNDTKLGHNWKIVQLVHYRHLWNIVEHEDPEVEDIDEADQRVQAAFQQHESDGAIFVPENEDHDFENLTRGDIDPDIVDEDVLKSISKSRTNEINDEDDESKDEEDEDESTDEEDETLIQYCEDDDDNTHIFHDEPEEDE
ncbi:hypothetical protein BUALT_Bualt17G0013000 [Buddleja alternifolia]|uniref:Transposase-associated domain-containing protein n=1 Tax=Buddleja alternifolia TaxID=168488 RepID=A0AAV6W5F5_9LAMI|nr:hypothetical protein BUALT_Bualt17G0013000 [Buddleja alternifolia]